MKVRLSTILNRADFMTVEDLISELKQMDPKSPVVFAYNYGDHWQTTVTPLVKTVDEGRIDWSEYHNMPKLIEADRGDEENDGEHNVVVLQA